MELDRKQKVQEEVRRAESEIKPNDIFLPHELEPEQLDQLVSLLSLDEDLTAASLVRKQIPHFPERCLYVLAVQARQKGIWKSSTEKEASLVKRLGMKVKLPEKVLIVSPTGSLGKLAKRVMQIQGGTVLTR